jgi:acetyl-CoA carboxylase carboxyltransferase component
MGGAQAAKTLLQIQKATLKAKGEEPNAQAEAQLLETITQRYNAQTSPYYAAARLWVDEIIDPAQTRMYISAGLQAANQSPEQRAFNPGVIQT